MFRDSFQTKPIYDSMIIVFLIRSVIINDDFLSQTMFKLGEDRLLSESGKGTDFNASAFKG